MAYCRCSNRHCQARKTLRRPPEQYVRPPKCPRCGRRKWRRDKYRAKVERGKASKPCRCHLRPLSGAGYWFPHRRGSRACAHNPGWTAEAAEQWASERGPKYVRG